MSEPLPVLKRRMLAMVGGTAPPPTVADDWAALDAMARQHRLQPLLAWRCDRGGWDIPPTVIEGWRDARQGSARASLRHQAALRLAARALTAAGIAFVALKGPRLAWHCYPEAGLRPMRDLDVLVPRAELRRAAAALAEAGFALDAGDAAIAEAIAHFNHLPPMWHARLGVTLELHHRVTLADPERGYRHPQLSPETLLERREGIVLAGFEAPVPSPEDLLIHLLVHALYSHRLDCGPLILADIHFLLAREAIDGSAIRRSAQSGGWVRGAALLLALTERYFGPQPLAIGEPPPGPVMAAAEESLLQNFDTREHTLALSEILAARSPAALVGALGRRLTPAAHVVEDEGRGASALRFWPGWAWRRLRRLASRLSDRRAASEAHSTAELLRWLQG